MKVALLFSGGLDSTTLLYELLEEGHQVLPVSIHYGQRHWKELNASAFILQGLNIAPIRIELDVGRLLKGSSQTDKSVNVPEGHYADESMKTTVVPNRNMMMLSIAGAIGIANDCSAVAYACHAGDHAIYPDCRPEFVNVMAEAFKLCHFDPVQLLTPYLLLKKSDIVRIGSEISVPYQLTWSCYKGGSYHCGKCGTCVERREAFVHAGVKDPTEYAK